MFTIFMMIVVFGGGLWIGNWWDKHTWGKHPELERIAKLMLTDSTMRELKEFTISKAGYLKDKTFIKLCERIEELTNDDIINEDDNKLKVRISSLEDKEVELKKLHAESFIETMKTLKTMCTGGKRR